VGCELLWLCFDFLQVAAILDVSWQRRQNQVVEEIFIPIRATMLIKQKLVAAKISNFLIVLILRAFPPSRNKSRSTSYFIQLYLYSDFSNPVASQLGVKYFQ